LITKPVALDTHSAPGSIAQYFLYTFLSSVDGGAITALSITAIILLIMLFYVSGAEVALFSLNYKDISDFKVMHHASARRIVGFLENPKGLLGSLTIANSLLTIGIIIILNRLIGFILPEGSMNWILLFLIKVAIMGFVLMLFGEMLPKIWASQHNRRFAFNSSFAIGIIYSLFSRISKPLISVSDSIDNRFSNDDKPKLDGALLDYAIDELPDNEASKEEKQILKGIRKFGNTTVKQVMKPRLEVSGIEFNTPFADVLRRVEELHYSRLPVYEGTLDEIRGVIHTKDLLPHLTNHTLDWKTLVRQTYFVHEQKMIEDLLQDFRTRRIHFAVVVDEFGGTSGIVTLEDVLEEVIGDIKDEFDEEEAGNVKIDDHTYVFDGRTMLNDACKTMNVAPDIFGDVRGDSDSIGGLVLELAEEIPQAGQQITHGTFTFTVAELEKNRIKKVKVTIQPATAS
jgi:putative hemolysin